ncbi:MAG: hypothetical protein GX051_09400 [Clostridiales bacterium]|nr:hypothetical protein [Clostridiales bacterium]
MLTVFTVRETGNGFRSRIKEHFNPSAAQVCKISVPGGVPFVALSAVKRRGEIDWEDASAAIGGKSTYTLFADGISPVADTPFRRFVPQQLPKIMLFNTAKEIIRRCCEPLSCSVCVVDGDGVLAPYAHTLCPLTREVRVLTGSGYYERCARKALEEYGAALVIAGRDCAQIKGTCIISVCNNGSREQSNTLLLNGENARFVIKGADFTVPDEYASLCPDGINPKLFAEALYECCAAPGLANLIFSDVSVNGKVLALDSATLYINKILDNVGNI